MYGKTSHAPRVTRRGGLRWSSSERRGRPPVVERRSAAVRPPVVEQRAPASGCRDHSLAVAVAGGGNAQRRGGVRRGVAVCSRVAELVETSAVVEQRAPVERVETTTSRAPETVRRYLSTCPESRPIPGPGLSVVDARIPCMTTVFDEPRQHPVTCPIAAVPRRPRRARRPRDCGPCIRPRPRLDRTTLRLGEPRCGTRSPSSSSARPPRRPPRPRREPRCRRHRRLVGQHHPADQTGRQTSPGARATPWTTTTSRSGTRWPPARSPRSRRW